MIAIIPARGGSKGLPGKNIKLLNGKPLIAYTIEAAKQSKSITRIIVSTDDQNIADAALEYGAEIPFLRPSHLATDDALAIDVLKYTIERLKEEQNSIEEFIVLQPTSPLRTPLNIDEAVNLFRGKNADSVISYCKEHHPIRWHKYITEEGKFENIFDDTLQNRQMEKPTYFPNGAIYIYKTEIINTGKYYTENSFAYIMERESSIDIDDIQDFEYAEFLLKKK
ncbi:acylneuraminate cytidylyltransferase family protein [Flavobacteriaceae bacterium W22]|nr:acylneuraminate cytidylyltransferase family protein [Flavobacteriaceae bacterium W22]